MPSPILGGDALVSCPSPTEALSCSSSEAAALPASLPHALASLLPWAAPAYSPGWSQAPAGFLPPMSRGPSGMCGGLHSLCGSEASLAHTGRPAPPPVFCGGPVSPGTAASLHPLAQLSDLDTALCSPHSGCPWPSEHAALVSLTIGVPTVPPRAAPWPALLCQ